MTTSSAPPALTDIGFSWRGHRAALWWLGLLYRRPDEFQKAIEKTGGSSSLKAGAVLLLSAIPYCISFCIFIPIIIAFIKTNNNSTFAELLISLYKNAFFRGVAVGTAVGIASGITSGIASRFTGGLPGAITIGIAGAIAAGIAGGIASGIASLIAGGISVGIAGGIIAGIAGATAAGIAVAIAGGAVGGISVGMAVAIAGGGMSRRMLQI